MNSLVTSNIRQRPLRSTISVIGVALGVALVMLFTGLARGMSNDLQQRSSNVRAEILFTRPGSIQFTSSSTNLSTKYVERLRQIDGVESATPVIRYFYPSGSFGVDQVEGVEWNDFAKMNNIRLVQGHEPRQADEVAIDEIIGPYRGSTPAYRSDQWRHAFEGSSLFALADQVQISFAQTLDAEGFVDNLRPNPIAIHDDDGIALLGHRHYPQVTVLSTRTEHEASVDECRTGVRQFFLSSSNYLPFGTVRLNYGSCPQSCASRTTELGRINGIFSESRICRRLFPRTESDQSGSCPAETELSFRPNRLGSLG